MAGLPEARERPGPDPGPAERAPAAPPHPSASPSPDAVTQPSSPDDSSLAVALEGLDAAGTSTGRQALHRRIYRGDLRSIDFEILNEFCTQHPRPREGVQLDFKVEFPNRLEKTIASFANSEGGVILIGVDEEPDTGEPELPLVGVPLERGLRERVIHIAMGAVHPPIFPEVKVCEFSPSGGVPDRAVVFVRVAQSDRAPHAVAGRTKVYRRVDNVSQPSRLVTLDELEWLQQRRRTCADRREELLARAAERAECYLQPRGGPGRRPPSDHAAVHRPPEIRPYRRVHAGPPLPAHPLATPEELLGFFLSDPFPTSPLAHFATLPCARSSPRAVDDGVAFLDRPRGTYLEINRFGPIFFHARLDPAAPPPAASGNRHRRPSGDWPPAESTDRRSTSSRDTPERLATAFDAGSALSLHAALLTLALRLCQYFGHRGQVQLHSSLHGVKNRPLLGETGPREGCTLGTDDWSRSCDVGIPPDPVHPTCGLPVGSGPLLEELQRDLRWAFGDLDARRAAAQDLVLLQDRL